MDAKHVIIRCLTPHCAFCLMAKKLLLLSNILWPARYPHTFFVRIISNNYHCGQILIHKSS